MRSIAKTVGAVRYVQSHTVDTPLIQPMIDSRGMSGVPQLVSGLDTESGV